MSNKTQFSDYEALSRSKAPGDSSLEVDEKDWSFVRPKQRVAEPGSVAIPLKGRSDAPMSSGPKAEAATLEPQKKENWLVKRGHAITFTGLLLFTFVLYFRPYEWSPSLAWLSSSAFWIAILTLAVFFPTQLALENRLTARPREVDLVLLLLLTSALSIPFALDRLIAWNCFVEYLKVVLMFIVMVNVVRTENRLKALLFLVMIASCMLSLWAWSDYDSGNLALKGERIEGVIGGIFSNPNDLAIHLVTMIPIAVALLLGTRGLAKKFFYAACAFLSVVGVIVTFSRAGFLGMAGATFVFGWRLFPRNRWMLPVLFAVLLPVMIVLAPGGYGKRISTTSDDSAAARTDDLKRSIFIAARHPVFGVGLANYILYSNSNHATHNAYTQVAAEAGLLSAVFYILFLIVPLKQLRRISRETSLDRPRSYIYYLSVGLEASLVGYMVSSFFASVAYVWYAYYIVGYAICLRRLHDIEKNAEVRS